MKCLRCQHGNPPQSRFCFECGARLALGKLYGKNGDAVQAREHLTMATTMYREMDMNFWLEKAEALTPPGS